MRSYLQELFQRTGIAWNRFWFNALDAASLCALRVAVGLIALYTLATYTPDLERYFGPQGLLSVDLAKFVTDTRETQMFLDGRFGLEFRGPDVDPEDPPNFRFSFLDYCTTSETLWGAHVASLIIVALFTLGFCTRVTSILALVVVVSYFHRGPPLTGPMEPILAMAIFFLCLAPAGQRYSIDGAIARARGSHVAANSSKGSFQPASETRRLSTGIVTRLLQVHLCLLYAMVAMGKLRSAQWWNGDALWQVIVRPEAPLVDLTGLPEIMINLWTHAVLLLDLSFPLLVWSGLLRPAMLAFSTCIWLSLTLITGLTPYCLLMIAMNLAFVSPERVQGLLSRASRDSLPSPPANA